MDEFDDIQTDFRNTNAYLTGNDIVDGLLIRENDIGGKKRVKYLYLLREIFQELNLSVIRWTSRYLLKVNQPNKYIDVPDGYLYFSSIGVLNEHGKFEPLVVNDNIDTDIIDLGASTQCGCSCGCQTPYCSQIQNYELVNSTMDAKMPDNSVQTFNTYTRKKVLNDGRFVQEYTQPVQIFNNNVHTDTVLQTFTNTLCQLDIKPCGCIKETPENEHLLFLFADGYTIGYDCGCPVAVVREDRRFYKINQTGNRIHFPPDFPYDTVLLRCYMDVKTKDLRVPFIAAKALRLGIKAEETTFLAPGSNENIAYMRLYEKQKGQLAEDMANLKLRNFFAHILGTFRVV